MKIPLPRRRARLDIDMVPMINFAFLLLIFFLLVGRFGPQDVIGATPPRAADAVTEPEVGRETLLLGADGSLAFGRARVDPSDLRHSLNAWRAAHPGEALAVRADANAEATRLIELLDGLRVAGVTDVKLLTRPIAL